MTKRISCLLLLSAALTYSASSLAKGTFEDGFNAASKGNYVEAVKIWTPLANNDDVLAQSNLGVLYENGWGVKQDPKKAYYWYKKAADQGQADAQHNVAALYEQGLGVQKDLNKAAEWYHKAAEQGHGDAQVILGVLYQQVEAYEDAAYWYSQAIKQNVEGAKKNLDYLCRIAGLSLAEYCGK